MLDLLVFIFSVLVLSALILLHSLSFETPYKKEIRYLARQPFFRFFAFLLVLIAMAWNTIIGTLMFYLVVFWLYDINILSTPVVQNHGA